MQNILIVENDLKRQKTLKENIQRRFPSWDIACARDCRRGSSLVVDSIRNKTIFSLFILEIQLNEDSDTMGGFTLAGEIRAQREYQMTPIMFLASVPDFIQEAISDYHCYNYIREPYSPADIVEEIQQMQETGALPENILDITDISRVRYKILLQDICYVEAKSHMIKIFTLTNEIVTRKITFAEIQERLAGILIRCHKKYLINLHHLSLYDRANRVIKINEYDVPVSRSYKNMLESKIMS